MFAIDGIELANRGFYINLQESIRRRNHVLDQIDKFSISGLDRFNAIRNKEITAASATDSQIAVFRQAKDNNLETIAVFEDDFVIKSNIVAIRNPNLSYTLKEYLEIIAQEIANVDWQVLFLGLNIRKKTMPVTKHLSRLFKSTGAWAYIIKKPAYEFLIENTHYSRDRMAIDDLLPELTYHGFNCFVTNFCIADHAHGFPSTMQPQYESTDYREWILGNYHGNVWDGVDDPNISDMESFLDILWKRKENALKYIVRLNNFDGDISILEKLETKIPEFRNCYMEIPNSNFPDLNYFMRVESNLLLHKSNAFRLGWMPKEYYDIDLSQI